MPDPADAAVLDPQVNGCVHPERPRPDVRQIEGSAAVAAVVARCRPEVIGAYPISPQTHIVEGLSKLVDSGELTPCEYLNVESEFAAMSVCIGASAAGARTYTATASQGLLYMVEAVYNASGLGLPIVMTVANRAIGAPINIWNDHSDAMSQRDSGWLQLYARSNQEAVDLHVQGYRIAEELSLPVMVCMDGFVLTHAVERVDLPRQDDVDAFLPRFSPRQVLDPADPVSIGAMVGPEAFTEVRYLAHHKQLQALDLIEEVAADFAAHFGRDSGGLLHPYRVAAGGEHDDAPAETVVVALGSVLGTIEDVVDELRADGVAIGALGLGAFRPFPAAALAEALRGARRVVVVEKAFSVGVGGIVSAELRVALGGAGAPAPRVQTVVAGLGGRPITKASLRAVFTDAVADALDDLTFLDLDHDLVDGELRRQAQTRRSGPEAANLLRAVGERGQQPDENA
ncbi:MAG: hypothetical protein U0Q15_18085 [Kineosporiaceae bacterium]